MRLTAVYSMALKIVFLSKRPVHETSSFCSCFQVFRIRCVEKSGSPCPCHDVLPADAVGVPPNLRGGVPCRKRSLPVAAESAILQPADSPPAPRRSVLVARRAVHMTNVSYDGLARIRQDVRAPGGMGQAEGLRLRSSA